MTRELKTSRDGQYDFIGGGDSNRNPISISANQVAMAGNVAFRGGFASQRPGIKQVGVTFASSEHYDWFKANALQGGGRYIAPDGVTYLIASVGGRIFAINTDDWSATDRTPQQTIFTSSNFTSPASGSNVDVVVNSSSSLVAGHPLFIDGDRYTIMAIDGTTVTIRNDGDMDAGLIIRGGTNISALDANAAYAPQCWMEQADQYFIIQNGVNLPIIFDGPITRRSFVEYKEVPTGTVTRYGQGRLWVAINENEYVAGDIAGSSTGVLRFTENDYLNEGGAFKVPRTAGAIRAMRFIPMLDTALGHGPLLIGAEHAILTCNAPVERELWKAMKDPIQTYMALEYGIESDWSVAEVNGDLFYRSKDGWRSFIMAAREFNTWGNTPVSTELSGILKDDEPKLLKYTSSILFDNRLLMTINPQPDDDGWYHRGIASLDFTPLAKLGQKGVPAFDMAWTGVDPTMLLKATISGDERAFAFARGADESTELWEFTKTGKFDNDDGRIKSFVECKALDFRNPFELKRLKRCELFVDEVSGDVDFTVYYRPDSYPCWITWHSFDLHQRYRSDSDNTDEDEITVHLPGYKTRIKLPEPADTNIEADDKPARLGYTFQVRVEWTGRARLTKYMLLAEQVPEDVGYPV